MKPMLAATIDDIDKLKYPLYGSPKLDGIRCIIQDGVALSRTLKPIPNKHVQDLLRYLPNGLDGELMIAGATFNEIQSAVMSIEGTPNIEYHVFDVMGSSTYHDRFHGLSEFIRIIQKTDPNVISVPHTIINSKSDLLVFENQCLAEGYEGIMLRNPKSPYKHGRSTLKEGYLLKLKRFEDAEAVVIGFTELLHNENPSEINELGLSKRSSKKEGKVPANTLGNFIVKNIPSGEEFEVGTGKGLTQELRKHIWDNKELYLHKIITYRFQPSGTKDLPRFPVWHGFRDEIDTEH